MITKKETKEWIEWSKKVADLKVKLQRFAEKNDDNLRAKQELDLNKESDQKKLNDLEKVTARLRENYLKLVAGYEALMAEQELLEKKYAEKNKN